MGKGGGSSVPAPNPADYRLNQFTPQGNLRYGTVDAQGNFVFDPAAASAASQVQESPFTQAQRLRQEGLQRTFATQAGDAAQYLPYGGLTTAGLPGIPGYTGGGYVGSGGYYSPSGGYPQQPHIGGGQANDQAPPIMVTDGSIGGGLGAFKRAGVEPGMPGTRGTPTGMRPGGPVTYDQLRQAGAVNYVNQNIGDFAEFGLTAGTPGTPATGTGNRRMSLADAQRLPDWRRISTVAQQGDAGGGALGGYKIEIGGKELDLNPNTGAITEIGGGTAAVPGTPGSTRADIRTRLAEDASFRNLVAQRMGLGATPGGGPQPMPTADGGGAVGVPGGGLPGLNSAEAARRQAQQAFFAQQAMTLNPEFERAENRLRQGIANRGQYIAPGTAGGDEYRVFEDSRNRALQNAALGAVLAGNDEYARQVGLSQGVRGQLFGERGSVRGQELQDLAFMLANSQGGQLPQFQLQNPADYANALQAANIASAQNASANRNANISGLVGLAGAAATYFCWVAREVYGASDPRWLEFREWMMTRAPQWLYDAYLRNGPRWAAWISDKPRLKAVVRGLMNLARWSNR